VRQPIAAFAIVLTFSVTGLLAGCGTTGDGEADEKTTTTAAKTTTTAPSSSTTTAPEPDGESQARAEAIDVSLDELPAGWDSVPHEPDEQNLITECSDFDVDALALATHFTEDFTLGDLEANNGQTVSVGTRVFEDESTATDIMDALTQDDFISCANEQVKASIGGTVEGEIAARELSTSADQTEGFSGPLTVTSTSTGKTVDLFVAFVAIRTGDLITGMSGFAIGQDLDGQVIDDLVDRIVALQAA
jgi:hypothetical protein